MTQALTAAVLTAALKRAAGIVEKRSTIPIVGHVLLEAKAGVLTITSTDLDMEWIESLEAPGLRDFKTTASLEGLNKVMAGGQGPVMLSSGEDKGKMKTVVEVSGLRASLLACDAIDFPLMIEPTEGASTLAVMPVSQLLSSLRFVASAISTEVTRYYLNGAYMHVAEVGGVSKLMTVATDGSRLMLDEIDNPGFKANEGGWIIPRKAVLWLLKHADGESASVRFWDSKLEVTTGRGRMLTKLIDGNFPDYRRVVRTEKGQILIAIEDPKTWVAPIRRLVAMKSEKSAAFRIHANAGDEEVTASIRSVDGLEADMKMPASVIGGGSREPAFNGNLLIDILNSGGACVLDVSGTNDPAIFTWPEEPGRTGVLMGLRE